MLSTFIFITAPENIHFLLKENKSKTMEMKTTTAKRKNFHDRIALNLERN